MHSKSKSSAYHFNIQCRSIVCIMLYSFPSDCFSLLNSELYWPGLILFDSNLLECELRISVCLAYFLRVRMGPEHGTVSPELGLGQWGVSPGRPLLLSSLPPSLHSLLCPVCSTFAVRKIEKQHWDEIRCALGCKKIIINKCQDFLNMKSRKKWSMQVDEINNVNRFIRHSNFSCSTCRKLFT